MDFPDIDNDYTAGSDPNAAWTDDANAWDGNSNTYAYRTLPTSSGKETTNYLLFSGNEADIEDAAITRVTIFVSAVRQSSDVTVYVVPYFDGSDAGEEHFAQFGYMSNDTEDFEIPIDITEDTNAPATWTWEDVQNVDIRIYGENTNASSTRYLRIYRVWIDVFWESYGMKIYDDDGNVTYDTTRRVSRVLYQGTVDCSTAGSLLLPGINPSQFESIDVFAYSLSADIDPPEFVEESGIYSLIISWDPSWWTAWTFGDTEILVLGR